MLNFIVGALVFGFGALFGAAVSNMDKRQSKEDRTSFGEGGPSGPRSI